MANTGGCSHCDIEFDLDILARWRGDGAYKCPFCGGAVKGLEHVTSISSVTAPVALEELPEEEVWGDPLHDVICPTEADRLTPAENSALVILKPYITGQLQTVYWGGYKPHKQIYFSQLEEVLGFVFTFRLAHAIKRLYEQKNWRVGVMNNISMWGAPHLYFALKEE